MRAGTIAIADRIIKINSRFLNAGHDYYAVYRGSNKLVKQMKECV